MITDVCVGRRGQRGHFFKYPTLDVAGDLVSVPMVCNQYSETY